jgi:hypothetical protein
MEYYLISPYLPGQTGAAEVLRAQNSREPADLQPLGRHLDAISGVVLQDVTASGISIVSPSKAGSTWAGSFVRSSS